MPNHITNILTIDGSLSRVKEIYNAISPGAPGPNDKAVEEPETDSPFKPASRAELAIRRKDIHEIDFTKIIPPPQGEHDSYNWNVANWGTKWNAYDQEMIDDHTLEFLTAWSMPEPVIKALSEMFPDVLVKIKWADEDLASNCGEIHYKGGREVYANIPDSQSKEAYELAFEILGGEDMYKFDEKTGTYKYIEESKLAAKELLNRLQEVTCNG